MKKTNIFEKVLKESDKIRANSDDWLIKIDFQIEKFVESLKYAVVGKDPDFREFNESKLNDNDYIRYLSNVKTYYSYIEIEINLVGTLPNIDSERATLVCRDINMHTSSLRQLRMEIQSEEDIFKRCIIMGVIESYKIILNEEPRGKSRGSSLERKFIILAGAIPSFLFLNFMLNVVNLTAASSGVWTPPSNQIIRILNDYNTANNTTISIPNRFKRYS